MSAPRQQGNTGPVPVTGPATVDISHDARAATGANPAAVVAQAEQTADERIADRGWGMTLRVGCIRLTSAVASRIAAASPPAAGSRAGRRRRWVWISGSLLAGGAAYASSRGWR